MNPECSQQWVHVRLVWRPSIGLLHASVLLGHFQPVVFDLYVCCSISTPLKRLILNEWSQCPLICKTRRLNVMRIAIWLDNHRLAVVAYLALIAPDRKPDYRWLILMLMVHEFLYITTIARKLTQSQSKLLCNQHHTHALLIEEISTKVAVVGRWSDSRRDVIDTLKHALSDFDNYVIPFFAVCAFTEGTGRIVSNLLIKIDNLGLRNLYRLSYLFSSNWYITALKWFWSKPKTARRISMQLLAFFHSNMSILSLPNF